MLKGGVEVPEHIDWKKIRCELFQSLQTLQKKGSGERNFPISCETERGRGERRSSEEGTRSPQLDEDGFEYAHDEQAKSFTERKDKQDDLHCGQEGGGGGGEERIEDIKCNGGNFFSTEEHAQEMSTEEEPSDKSKKERDLPSKEEDCTTRGGGGAVSLKESDHGKKHWTENRCRAERVSTGLGNEMNKLRLEEAGENKSASEEERSEEKRGERRSLSEDGLESLAKVHKRDGGGA